MLNSRHPAITKFVIDYHRNGRSDMRYELVKKIKAGEDVKHCVIPIALDSSMNKQQQRYLGFIFEHKGKTLALVSDHMDYAQDVLIDVSQLSAPPEIGPAATLDSFKHLENNGQPRSIDFHADLEINYAQSLFKTCERVVAEYVKLRNILPLPKLDDPLLAEMVKWRKSNSYQPGYMAEFKHQLSQGLSTLSNINHLLEKQKDILPHVLSQITLPQERFNITQGGLDSVNQQLTSFASIAKYGLNIAIHVHDNNVVDYIISNHSHEEIIRISDPAEFKTRNVELHGYTHSVLSYELEPSRIDMLLANVKRDMLPHHFIPVLDAIATTDTQKGLRLISMNNEPSAIYAAEESARLTGRPCFALYNNAISSDNFMDEMTRHNHCFPEITLRASSQHPAFTLPCERPKNAKTPEYSEMTF